MTWIRDEIRDPSHFLSNLYLPLLLSVWYTSKTYHGWSKYLHNVAREESAGNVLRVLQIEGPHLCTLILYYPIWGSHSVVCKRWNEPGKWRSVPPLLYSDDVFVLVQIYLLRNSWSSFRPFESEARLQQSKVYPCWRKAQWFAQQILIL